MEQQVRTQVQRPEKIFEDKRMTNGLASILLFTSVAAIGVNLFNQDYQRVVLYSILNISFCAVFFLNFFNKGFFAKVVLAFFPGLALFLAAFFYGGLLEGDRQGYFYALIILSTIPLLLFSDSKSRVLLVMGCVYYVLLIILFDVFLTFTEVNYKITVSMKLKELIFYGAIAAGFAWKINQKTRMELLLKDKNTLLANQNNDIETLFEEVKAQKEELFIQQETLFVQNNQLSKQKDELLDINTRLEKNNDALIELASTEALTQGNYEESLKIITRLAAIAINVSRVSVWEFIRDKQAVVCKNLYSIYTGEHECGGELSASDYPIYFQSIRANKTIVAEDVRSNVYTSEFNDSYLIPSQIYSMLDSPYFINGEVHGIICFEQQRTKRVWTQEDVLFSRAIADFVPLAYESMVRKRAQDEIVTQNEALISKQKQITQLNEQLEQKVKHRTLELETRNRQLEEFAFFNAHILRAPLCSLQGLLAVADVDDQIKYNDDFMSHLKNSLDQMAEVTKQMSEQLHQVKSQNS